MIKPLTSLRFYVMFTIFLSHLTFLCSSDVGRYVYENFLRNGSIGVTLFFVLSGFVINIGYGEKFKECGVKDYICFQKKRIIKIYPLYLVTMIVMFVFNIHSFESLSDIFKNIIRFAFCIPMLQSLIPIQEVAQSFNGAAWFLSCLFVLYLVTPLVLKWNYRIRKSKIWSIICLSLMIILVPIIVVFSKKFLDEKYLIGFIYCSPYMRITNYLSGIFLANIYLNSKEKIDGSISVKKATWGEGLAIIIFLITYIFVPQLPGEIAYTLYVLTSLLCVLCFSYSKGKVSCFLSKYMNIFLGNISFEFYLIHYPLISIGYYLVTKYNVYPTKLVMWSVIFFVVSLTFAILVYKLMRNKSYKVMK